MYISIFFFFGLLLFSLTFFPCLLLNIHLSLPHCCSWLHQLCGVSRDCGAFSGAWTGAWMDFECFILDLHDLYLVASVQDALMFF